MRKPTFPERSAHLSYVAPLIGVVVVRQLGTPPAALALLALLVLGGLFSALTGLVWSRKERGKTSLPALLGIAANLAFVVWVVASYPSAA